MTTHDNAAPPADWKPEPRCCPFADCGLCETPQQAEWRHQALAEQPIPAKGVE